MRLLQMIRQLWKTSGKTKSELFQYHVVEYAHSLMVERHVYIGHFGARYCCHHTIFVGSDDDCLM